MLATTMAFGMDIGYNAGSADIDHGFFRVADQRFVDYGGHGDREHRDPVDGSLRVGSGEFHQTGLLHRGVGDYLDKRKADSRVLMELAFDADPDEIKAAIAFHNLRRAGVVNNVMESVVRYNAGMDADKVPQWLKDRTRTMVGMRYTENCVTYGTATRIGEQIGFLEWKVGELGFQARDLFQRADVQRLVKRAAAKLGSAETDWRDPKVLFPQMFDTAEYHELVAPIIAGRNLSPEQRGDLIAYLIALHVSSTYQAVVFAQGAQNYVGVDADPWDHRPRAYADKKPEMDSQNPRAVAIVVYADWPDAEQLVREGRFEYGGRAHGLLRSENSRAGNRQRPL
jgi:hypothetical protein